MLTRPLVAVTLALIGATSVGAARGAPPSGVTSGQGGGAPTLEFAFSETVLLGSNVHPGPTAYGMRNIVPITGGTFQGPGIRGTILPGGWDWQLGRADGCLDIKADYMLKTDDGVIINVVNKGVACPPASGSASQPVGTLPVFEAPRGKYEWLAKAAFIGTLEGGRSSDGSPMVRIGFYRVR